MKKLIYCLFAILPAYFIIQGCNKLDGIISANGQLTATKSEVKINEPDTLVAVDAKATDNISWIVTPGGANSISTNKNAAAIKFTQAGTYNVKASINGVNTESLTIKVNSSVYTPPAGSTTLPLTGDQMSITPGLYKSVYSDSTYIYFNFQTTNTYCVTDRLNFTGSVDAGNYQLAFNNITEFGTCTGSTSTLHGGLNFKQSAALLANGTYPLNISLNGTTYTGSIVVTSATITFNWTYTSGVVINPKIITR